MASLVPPDFDVLVSISNELSQRVAEIAAARAAPSPAVQLRTIAALLNNTPAEVEKHLLDTLREDDAQMVAEIRELMFTWEDLADLDRRAMQKVLSSVDARTLAVALKGSSDTVEHNVMVNLSARVREMIKEERELAGAMPLQSVLEARAEVMKAVRALLDAGEFSPVRGGDDLVV
jgi:flagellar motor switch protein FliG